MTDKPRCFDHKDAATLPRLCRTCQRIAVEAELVTRAVDAFLAAGYLLQADVNEDPRPEKPTGDRGAILAEMMEVDDEFLGVWFGRPAGGDLRPDAWVRFVYGNDGWDVISDYTTNLESILAPVNQYAESLDI